MPASVTHGAVAGLDEAAVTAQLVADGHVPQSWTGHPGEHFGWHSHGHYKILYAVAGSLTFELRDGSRHTVGAGDRLDLPPASEHAATVGPDGVRCVEAFGIAP